MFIPMSFSNTENMMPTMRLNDSYVICLTLLNLIIVMCCKACHTAEYEINGECCPMCPPGTCYSFLKTPCSLSSGTFASSKCNQWANAYETCLRIRCYCPGHHVLQNCNSHSGTSCKVCIESTYTDVPNGLLACLTCIVCDEGDGLKVKSKCTHTSDAVCEPLPGHYCIEHQGEGCRKAHEHSSCLPGQYIYQTGTAVKDTVCKDCSEETYSNGSFVQCKTHTNCESLGQITITQGTRLSDAVCSDKPSHLGPVIGILVTVILLIFIISVLVWMTKKKLGIV